MTLVQIPNLAEIGAGIGLIAGGACDKASSAVQHFVNTPSVAENGLNLLAAQIDVLEQLVAALREVAVGIEAVHDKLAVTVDLEWQSPAGNAFRQATASRQQQAQALQQTTMETAALASRGIDELRLLLSSLQSLLAAARTTAGTTAGATIAQVCA